MKKGGKDERREERSWNAKKGRGGGEGEVGEEEEGRGGEFGLTK